MPNSVDQLIRHDFCLLYLNSILKSVLPRKWGSGLVTTQDRLEPGLAAKLVAARDFKPMTLCWFLSPLLCLTVGHTSRQLQLPVGYTRSDFLKTISDSGPQLK